MWHKKGKERSVVNWQAVTLVEILTTLALGALLLLFASQFYVRVYHNQTNQRELLSLQQNVHQLLNYFQQHIPNIGYQGIKRQESNFPLFLINGKPYALSHPHCFVFLYDVNGDGCIGNRNKNNACEINQRNKTNQVAKELFGFQWKNKSIFIFNDNRYFSNCVGKQCQSWASCDKNKWDNLADLVDYQVEALTFEWKVPNNILSIQLTLSSIKFPHIQYTATAYSHLLNHQ